MPKPNEEDRTGETERTMQAGDHQEFRVDGVDPEKQADPAANTETATVTADTSGTTIAPIPPGRLEPRPKRKLEITSALVPPSGKPATIRRPRLVWLQKGVVIGDLPYRPDGMTRDEVFAMWPKAAQRQALAKIEHDGKPVIAFVHDQDTAESEEDDPPDEEQQAAG